jgi:hypothetical protein
MAKILADKEQPQGLVYLSNPSRNFKKISGKSLKGATV